MTKIDIMNISILYDINETNNDIMIDFFGYFSIAMSMIKIVPQIIKIFITKKTGDISSIFLIIGLFAGISSIIHGYLINEYPVIIRNIIFFSQMMIIFISKIYFDSKNKGIENKQNNEKV